MRSFSRCLVVMAMVAAGALATVVSANFRDDREAKWGPDNAKLTYDGNGLSLSLDNSSSGSLIRTRKMFFHGSLSALIQLVTGNSAGTITTLYMSSVGGSHDEIDFEFLGNEAGKPYTIHINLYVADIGNREMQFKPWFDPTTGFHNYTISWCPCMIVWYVDSVPIRVFRNYQASHGAAFPTSRPMYAYCSIWASDSDSATQRGRVKADWSRAPFVAHYRDMGLDVCDCSSSSGGGCVTNCPAAAAPAYGGACRLSDAELGQMRLVQSQGVFRPCFFSTGK